jgi:hypothetical protein
MAADTLAAVIAFLLADAGVAAQVETRVHAPELTQATSLAMPTSAIVIHRSGGVGPGSGSFLELQAQRLDIKCYGETPYRSGQVYIALRAALKNLHRQVYAETLLHTAQEESGAMDMREPEVDWPVTFSVWTLLAGEATAS